MPLTFDMPLDQLKSYSGCNPRPDDFDQYWDHALAEMNAIDPSVDLISAEFPRPDISKRSGRDWREP